MTPEFHPYVDCEQCGKRKFHSLMFKTKLWFGDDIGMKTVYFCGENVANEYRLEMLRRGEQ